MTRNEFEASWPVRSMRTRQGRSFRLYCPGTPDSAELFMHGSLDKGVSVDLLIGTGRKRMKTFTFAPGAVASEQEAAERSIRMAFAYAERAAAFFASMKKELGEALPGLG